MKQRGQFVNPEVRQEAEHLLALGWSYEGIDGNSHHQFSHSEFGRTSLPFSPSDHRWVKNSRSQVARRMGLTLGQLEERLGIKVKRNPNRRKRDKLSLRAKREKRAKERMHLMPAESSVPAEEIVPPEPPTAAEIDAAHRRGDKAEYDRLLAASAAHAAVLAQQWADEDAA